MNQTHKTYVLYHANCQDGLGAKYAAFKKYQDEAVYIPVSYNKPLPEIEDNSDVFILDFSYSRDVLLALKARSNSVLVLDHHKTAQEDLRGLDFAVFDMNKSGAVLTWEYFHPGTRMPGILSRIQDRDIWRWQYSDTANVLNMVTLAEEDFAQWDRLEAEFDSLAVKGESITQYQRQWITKETNPAGVAIRPRVFNGYTAGILNSTHLVSEVGNAVCELPDVDFAIIYKVKPDGTLLIGLRSTDDDVDVSLFARHLGGGGHKHASGVNGIPFSFITTLLENKYDNLIL